MDLILPSTFGEIHTNLCPFSSMINLFLNLDILFVFVDIRRHIFNIYNGNNNYYYSSFSPYLLLLCYFSFKYFFGSQYFVIPLKNFNISLNVSIPAIGSINILHGFSISKPSPPDAMYICAANLYAFYSFSNYLLTYTS